MQLMVACQRCVQHAADGCLSAMLEAQHGHCRMHTHMHALTWQEAERKQRMDAKLKELQLDGLVGLDDKEAK